MIRKTRVPAMLTALLVVGALGATDASAQLEEKLDALAEATAGLHDGDAVSLQECIQVARIASTRLGLAEEDLGVARTARQRAWAQWLPDLGASGNWQRSERTDFDQQVLATQLFPVFFVDSNGAPLGPLQVNGEDAYAAGQVPTGQVEDTTILQTFSSASLSTNWTLFDGFARTAGMKSSRAGLEAAEASLGYQDALLVQDVTNAYYDYLNSRLRVEVAEEAEQLAARELERSETYYDLGISTRSDVLQAKVRHEQTRLDVVVARNAARNAFVSLANFMGIPASRIFEVETDVPEVGGGELPAAEELVDLAMQRRQDLEASRADLEAQQAGVTQARSGLYPSVQVFGQVTQSRSETPFRFGASENRSLAWGIQGSWNIFDRYQTKLSSRQAVAARRRAEYNLRQAELDAQAEIVTLRNNLVEARERAALSQSTVEQASEDLRLANERFKVGAGTSLDVINAQVNLATARRDLVDARTDHLKFLNQLRRAVGGPLR